MRKRKDLSDLIRAKLGYLDDWVKAFPKPQAFWGVPNIQWSVSTKSGPGKDNQLTINRPSHNLQDSQDLQLFSWWQIPLDTFRGLKESMLRQVTEVLVSGGGSTQ